VGRRRTIRLRQPRVPVLDQRHPTGGRATHARLIIFARGFDQRLIEQAALDDVTLIPAHQLFA